MLRQLILNCILVEEQVLWDFKKAFLLHADRDLFFCFIVSGGTELRCMLFLGNAGAAKSA